MMRSVLLILVLVIVLVCTVAEPLAPTATLTAAPVLGPRARVEATVHDRGWGLAEVELRMVPTGGGEPKLLARQSFPRRLGIGSGVREVTLIGELDANPRALTEGPVTLEVWARDWSWLNLFRRAPTIAQSATIDVTPPRIQVLTSQHRMKEGGSELVVYRVSPDAAESGVIVTDTVFPGVAGYLKDPALRVALFAIPYGQGGAVPQAFATDEAGNRALAPLDITTARGNFASKRLDLSDAFLQKKVPELLQANDLPPAADLVEGYLRINRGLRADTEARVRDLCRPSTPVRHWSAGLERLPNAAPLAGYGDARTYWYGDRAIDKQIHLGFDLASLKGAIVPAAEAGTVTFAGPLGIYGDTVILDHGLGLYTLYGHLREIDVKAGDAVTRGQPVGRTGETGLAGGDHLHFSTMVNGTHVNPVEWWDGHWIHDHAVARLEPFEAGGS